MSVVLGYPGLRSHLLWSVTAVSVRDDDVQLTLVTDATMGGSSLSEGQVHRTCCGHFSRTAATVTAHYLVLILIMQIELMVHRRLLQDDGLGVMEPLNETDAGCSSYPTQVPDWTSLCAPLPACARSGTGIVSRGLLMLTLEPPARAARVWRPLAHANYMQVSVQWLNPCHDYILHPFMLKFIVNVFHTSRPPPAYRGYRPKFLPASSYTPVTRHSLASSPFFPPSLY